MLKLAKRGDEKAIASLLNHLCQDRAIQVVEATLNHGCLRIVLESLEICDRDSSVALLHQAVTDLTIDSAKSLMICARQPGKYVPLWSETLALTNPVKNDISNNTKSANSQGPIQNKLQRWLAKFPLTSFIVSAREWEN